MAQQAGAGRATAVSVRPGRRGTHQYDATAFSDCHAVPIHHLHLHPAARRMTDVNAVVVREGKNVRGRALGLVLGTIGKRVLAKASDNTIKAVVARNRHTQATSHERSITSGFEARRAVGRQV